MKALALMAALSATNVAAQTADTIRLAKELGAALAAEQPCGLTYDITAIETWLDTRVEAANMSFAPTLSTMTTGAAFTLGQMTDSQRAAHCAQTRRVALALGFIAP